METHKHFCKNCGHWWEHGQEAAGDDEAHTCHLCGTMSWFWVTDEELGYALRRFAERVRPKTRPARRAA